MSDRDTDPLAELKQIAAIKFDRERHRLAAIKEELSQLENERTALNKEIGEVANGKETSPAAMINTFSYLAALTGKASRLDQERAKSHARTEAQRDKIKKALASKIRIDGMEGE